MVKKEYSINQKIIYWIFTVVTVLFGIWLAKVLIKAIF